MRKHFYREWKEKQTYHEMRDFFESNLVRERDGKMWLRIMKELGDIRLAQLVSFPVPAYVCLYYQLSFFMKVTCVRPSVPHTADPD